MNWATNLLFVLFAVWTLLSIFNHGCTIYLWILKRRLKKMAAGAAGPTYRLELEQSLQERIRDVYGRTGRSESDYNLTQFESGIIYGDRSVGSCFGRREIYKHGIGQLCLLIPDNLFRHTAGNTHVCDMKREPSP